MKKKQKDKLFENLPGCAADFIKLIIKKMRYRKKVRADVMAELASHFEDELKDCKSDEEKGERAQHLIDEFGDAKMLGILVRRAKRRCRPLWRTIVARGFQAVGILILCSIVYTGWFFSGKPNPTINYIEQVNNLARPVADESLNAESLYAEAAETIDALPKKSKELLGKKYNEVNDIEKQEIERLLEDNKKAFELVTAGTEKPYYWQKLGTQSDRSALIEVFMPNLAEFRRIALGLRWRANLRAETGQYEEAFSDLITCYKMGRHLKGGKKSLIEQLVGIAIEDVATQTTRDILSRYNIKAGLLAKLQKDLEKAITNEDFAVSFELERFFMYDELQRCFTEDRLGGGHLYLPRILQLSEGLEKPFEGPDYYVMTLGMAWRFLFAHPNKQETLESVNEFYDFCGELADKSAYEIHLEKEAIDEELGKFMDENIFIEILSPAFMQVVQISSRSRVDIYSTLAVIALFRYEQERGGYPESLEDLVEAGYLDSVPMDPFSDKPLVYKRGDEGFTLYSVGTNFVDDGGKVHRDDKGRVRLWDKEHGDAVFWPAITN